MLSGVEVGERTLMGETSGLQRLGCQLSTGALKEQACHGATGGRWGMGGGLSVPFPPTPGGGLPLRGGSERGDPLGKGMQVRWKKSHNFSPLEKGLQWSCLP